MNTPKRYSKLKTCDQMLLENKYEFKDALNDISTTNGDLDCCIERDFEGLEENDGQPITIRFTLCEVLNIACAKYYKLKNKVESKDVALVVHAEWKDNGANFKCSNCGNTETYDDMLFCPKCGAKMDKKRIPTEDVAPVVHAHFYYAFDGEGYCSHCDGLSDLKNAYCPHCGAKMDEDT